jgi:SAM-dependent methyltransferase
VKILNLGCGNKTSDHSDVINVDWSIYLRIKKNRLIRIIAPWVIGETRLKKLDMIPDNIMVYNISRGLPFKSDSIDVIYHSHVLEHVDRNLTQVFLLEAKRVLKPGGVHRIVVPDLEYLCKAYLAHWLKCEIDTDECQKHDLYIAALLEQSVRKEAYGTSLQRPLRRFLENVFIGDARRRGETHQWMYDKINLKTMLVNLGYKEVHILEYNTSLVNDWNKYGLDTDQHGNQYKPNSLYIEAVK